MSEELYHHLLIPTSAEYTAEPSSVAIFFSKLESLGAMPKQPRFTVVTHTGRTRAIGRNPSTGDVIHGPELKVGKYTDAASAFESIIGEKFFDISAEGAGPPAVSPFPLYSADRYDSPEPGKRWTEDYGFSIHCQLRPELTCLLHWPFGCQNCAPKTREPSMLKNPWTGKALTLTSPDCARFWIQYGIGNWRRPLITDSPDILDHRIVELADVAFQTSFAQGFGEIDL